MTCFFFPHYSVAKTCQLIGAVLSFSFCVAHHRVNKPSCSPTPLLVNMLEVFNFWLSQASAISFLIHLVS